MLAPLIMILARWLLFVSAVGVIGGLGATLLARPADARIMRTTRASAFIWLLGAVLLIGAQLYLWFGVYGFTTLNNVRTMLSLTSWGEHWIWLAATATAAIVLLSAGRRWPATWSTAGGAAAAGAMAVLPLVGHGGTHDAWTLLWHRVHLLGAGTWVGTLGVLTVSGITDPKTLLARLRHLAPLAFVGALLLVASGIALTWRHMLPLSTFWTTDYGRVLLAKFVGVIAVAALGFMNWRGPRLKLVVAELSIAFLVVLALTAWLSELEPPSLRQ